MTPFRSLAFLLALALPSSPAAEVRCPETISEGGKTLALSGISVYNGTPGGKEYELAPDGESKSGKRITQTWKVKDYRDMKVFLRCNYQGTKKALVRDVPEGITTCSQTFELNAKHEIAGKSEMSCR
ncbi:MAG: STY0301 family protein [Bryobacteraceae bacterium]